MLNFLWLDDFRSLAATGNFSRAAEERNVTQPAFGRRIRALEEWVGADLFDRSIQPTRLTEVGEWFRGVADELTIRVARIPEEARILVDTNALTLRIASTHALSFTFLPRWLRSLENNMTLGSVQLVSDVLQRCEVLLLQSKVQFVLSHAHPLAHGAMDDGAFLSALIGKDTLIPVSSPIERGQALYQLQEQPSSAESVPLLQYTQESGLGRIIKAVVGNQLESVPTRIAFTAHLASVLRTMALDGRGIAWLPESLIEDDLVSGSLVAAANKTWNIPLEIRLYRQAHSTSRSAEDFWKKASYE